MKKCMLFVSVLIGTVTTAFGGTIVLDDPTHVISLMYTHPTATLPHPSAFDNMSVLRLIRVTVSPAAPGPADTVSVTVTAESSDHYLTLDTQVVNRQGEDVVIDLYWSSHPPPASTGIQGLVQDQTTGMGYGVEQIHLNPSAIRADKEYEVTQPLGTFNPGTHKILVYSHGALEGEASAMFWVRDPAPAAGGIGDFMNIGGPMGVTNSIWSLLGLVP